MEQSSSTPSPDVTPPALNEVRALVQERERFDAWLDALEAKRDSTPERVFTRVRADYRARREGVLTALVAHVTPLSAWAGALAERQSALGAVRATHDEERAEAALRHAVGEFSDDQWDEVRARVDAALQGLESEDAILRAEREDVEQLLQSAQAGAALAQPTPAMPVVAVAAPTPAVPVVKVTTPTPAMGTPVNSVVIDDMQIMNLDDAGLIEIETGTPTHPTAAIADIASLALPESITPQSLTPPTISIDELFGSDGDDDASTTLTPHGADDEIEAAWQESAARGFGRDDQPPRVTQEVAALESFEVYTGPNAAVREATPPAPEEPVAPETVPVRSASGFDDLAFLRSLTASLEQTKTLRCTECNTMNFPTEWYCERCGGELAAL
jgi:hypothetical protein